MNFASHVCSWLAVGCFAGALVWTLLLGVDLVRHSRLPRPAVLLSLLSLFAVALISLGATVILAEAAKLRRGEGGTRDGVMYFVFCATAGAMLLLGSGGVAGVLILRRKRANDRAR
jgi:hypothetical protein